MCRCLPRLVFFVFLPCACLAAPEKRTPDVSPRPAYSAVVAGEWTKEKVSRALGPTFEVLDPGAVDDRPTLYKPPSKPGNCGFANRINPFELGERCFTDNDYWSESGQVAYVPDDPNDPGLDRIQVYAYYDHVFAISPRLDHASGTPHPDPQTREPSYARLLGRAPKHPVAMVRNYAMLQNEALVIFRGGLLAVAGTQTSREEGDKVYPGLMLPKTKVPTAIAVTAQNEFAVIAVTDTESGKGQLAVVALEGKYLPFHTWPYMGLPNQGSFSDMKLLGFVDLPLAKPTSVAAASNGWWGGPSQTNNQTLGQIDLREEGTRNGLREGEGGWSGIIATKGYAIVASHEENRAVFVDLTPLFSYVRESYLSSSDSFAKTVSNRGAAPDQWPVVFERNKAALPVVTREFTVSSPTAVLAGLILDRWSQDRHKAYVASEDGTIHIFDASSFMARWEWQKKEPLAKLGTFKVGRNPVSMVFTRHGDHPLPLLPRSEKGAVHAADPTNNTFYVACRGDREVVACVTWEGKGQVYRRIRDKRMGDPVAVSVATRGNIVSVADFNGKKVLSFRIGAIDGRHGEHYGVGEKGNDDHEFAGELPVAGHPFLINSANVN